MRVARVRRRAWYCTVASCLAFFASGMFGATASAQPAKPAAAPAPPISSEHVPEDAIAMLVFSPSELMASPLLEMFPIEIMRAQAMDQMGMDPFDLSLVKVLAGMPGPNGPTVAVVANSTSDMNLEGLLETMGAPVDAVDVDGRSVYVLPDTPGMLLHGVTPRTAVAATGDWLDTVITANNATGQLATLTATMPRPPGVTLIAALKPVRPFISGMAQQQAQQLPPDLQPLGQLPELVDALLVNVNVAGNGVTTRITMLCAGDDEASEVETILTDAISFGKQMAIAQAKQAAETSGQSEAVIAATMQYIDRVAMKVDTMLKPTRTGRRVSMSIQSDVGIASTGVMVGLLLPAVQAAREAARRMSASNNMKQISLAFHNYAAAYNYLPTDITDEDGKPLLSWRVAILPYIEEQALYEQFRLDEPWDSPHNKPLSEKLPAIYVNPKVALQPGYTVFQVPVGEGLAFQKGAKSRFRDFLDGTSNTVMLFEASRDEAVIWSKPEEAEIDPKDPLSAMGDYHVGGFHVGMTDGSVRFITNTIDIDLFNAMFTRAGGEAIQIP